MRLHGIELAKPEEWYMAIHSNPTVMEMLPIEQSRFGGFERVKGTPVDVAGLEGIEVFCGRLDGRFVVMVAATGTIIGSGWSSTEAITHAEGFVNHFGAEQAQRRIIGWLETHPLSPRYRYTGGCS